MFTVLYYFLTVWPHEIVGSFIGSLLKPMGRALSDQYTIYATMLLGLICTLSFILILLRHRDRALISIIYFGLTILFATISVRILMVRPLEAAHFIQYGILSILVFLLVRRFDYTVWITFVLAHIDEAYQHFFLTPNKFSYYDFNDVWLDQIGIGFGLTMLFASGFKIVKRTKSMNRLILGVYVLLILIGAALFLIGWMRLYPYPDGSFAPIQLWHERIDTFWSKGWKTNVFHVMQPWEGMVVSIATCLIYSALDRFAIPRNRGVRANQDYP